MTRFLWWLRKELREHRAALLLLALAIPLGSWLAAHLSRGQPPTPNQIREQWNAHARTSGAPIGPVGESFPHTWSREEWEYMLFLSAGLTLALVAGGLLGAEARRGTTTLIARTPGAWRHAFPAKLAFLALVVGVVVVLHAWILGQLAAAYDLQGRVLDPSLEAWLVQPVEATFLWPTEGRWFWLGAIFALGAWALAASAALPWVGVPVLAGCVLGVGTAVPSLIWASKHRYFLDWWLGGAWPGVLGTALLALALAAWGWHRYMRYGRSVAVTGLRLLGVALLVAGLGNAAAWAAVLRYRDFDAAVTDLRMQSPLLGVGDRFAYVNAYRGSLDADDAYGGTPGTDAVPWKIDLATGAWERCGGPREEWSRPGKSIPVVEAPIALLFIDDRDGDIATGTWFDARTGERLGPGLTDELPTGADERLRAAVREGSNVRDPQGRRAWLSQGRLERDGADPLPLEHGHAWRFHEIPGGWASGGYTWMGPHTSRTVPAGSVFSIEAATGRVREFAAPSDGLGRFVASWWDPAHALVFVFDLPPPTREHVPFVGVIQPQFTRLRRYRVVALEAASEEALVPADSPLGDAVLLARTGERTLLLGMGASPDIAFARWTVGDAAAVPATWDGPPLAGGIEDFERWGEGRGPPSMARTGEPVLLAVYGSRQFGRVTSPIRLPESRSLEAWLLYVPATNTLRVLRSWTGWTRDEVLRILPSGAVLVLEARRRIVRLGPEVGQRTVLFPR